MKLLVVGARGQIARALAKHDGVFAVGRPTLNLERPETFAPVLDAHRADVVAIVGAYTAVDRAESEPDVAMRINAEGPAALARACAARGAPVLYVSSDYVFDGRKAAPYVETDAASPQTAYGRSKTEGERGVLVAQPQSAIVRTSWVFDAAGQNFVRTMLRLAKTRERVGVVADQHGAPSYAPHVADGLLALAHALVQGEGAGVWHMTGAGDCTWAQFAEAIFVASAARGGPHATVNPITTAEFPTLARRPANSRLDTGKLARLGIMLPHWREGLEACVDEIAASGWDVA